MKRIIRVFAISIVSLYLASQVADGMVFGDGSTTLIYTGIALTLTSFLGKPIISILLLPLNLVTFGFFRWVSSAIALYIVTLIISDFRIDYFLFEGLQSKWLDIPSMNLKGVWAFVGFAFVLSFISSSIHWFTDK